jgi:hypothetical protein
VVNNLFAMKKILPAFALLCATAVYAAGCSGSNGNAFTPAAQGVAAFGRHRGHHHLMRAHVYLRIPHRRHRRRGRGPRYISPATQSLTFAVTPAGGSPLPLQTFTVATPSPCTTIPDSGGALQCSFTVSVLPGSDSFTIATYAAPSPTGSPLSQYVTPTAIAMPSPGGALGFTLEGVIAHVVMQYATSVPTTDSQSQSAAIPAGAATSAPLSVIPYDAAGFQILSQVQTGGSPVPYASPITLSVDPSSSGVTLSNDRGSGSSVTIANPNDLAVTVQYDGTVDTSSSGSVTNASFSILSSTRTETARRGAGVRVRPHGVSPSPSPSASPAADVASAVLASNAVPYQVVSGATPQPAGMAYDASSGRIAFGMLSYLPSGIVGSFSAADPAAVTTAGTAYGLQSPFVDNYGDIWVLDTTAGAADCFTSSVVPSALVPFTGPGSIQPGSITEDAAHNMWFSFVAYSYGYNDDGFEYAPLSGPCTLSAGPYSSIVSAPSGGSSYPNSSAPNNSGTGAWFGDSYESDLFAVAPGPNYSPAPSVTPLPLGGPQILAMGSGAGSVTYALTDNSDVYQLATVSSAGTLTVVAAAAGLPYVNYNEYPTIASNGRVAVGDGSNGEALFDPASTSVLDLPMPGVAPAYAYDQCGGAAFDANQTPWVLCSDGSGVNAYRVLLTPTWSVFPSDDPVVAVESGCPISYTLGVGEQFGLDSGPFTDVSSNPSLIATSSSPAGADHILPLTIQFPSSPTDVTVTVTDAHERSLPVHFTVLSGGLCGEERHRPVRHAGERPPAGSPGILQRLR